MNIDDIKGKTVTAQWFTIIKNANIPGSSGKFSDQARLPCTLKTITGKVNHVRGDHPTNPTTCGLFIEVAKGEPDAKYCDKHCCYELMVDPKHCKIV